MIQLYDNKGIPRSLLLMMAVVGGLTVANLYYNQPLLEEIRANLSISEVEANLITVMTQIGYALGLIFIMLLCLLVSLRCLPKAKPTYEGNYRGLMRTVVTIFLTHPRMRLYALRALFSFGSMMAIWSCIAFHLAGAPFHAGSDTVGMLGLCGVAGAMAASVVGKYVPRFGIQRISVFGSCLQMLAWLTAYFFGHTYGGIIAAIMLVDIGAQCQQLSNQSGCLAEVPGASNRANTIFMTSLFTGGCMGTFAAGMAWGSYGWTGICAVGMAFCLCSMMVSAYIGRKSAK